MSRICIVTGAGGYVGGNLFPYLWAKDEYDGYVLADKKQRQAWQISHIPPNGTGNPHKINWAGNVLDLFYNTTGTDRVDVFHLAGRARIGPSWDQPLEYFTHNTALTAELLRQCGEKAKTGTKVRFIFAGSSTCNGEKLLNPYAASKWFCEMLIEKARDDWYPGLEVKIGRIYNAYGGFGQYEGGPNATMMGIFEKAFREGRAIPVFGDGNQRRDFTHVHDTCRRLEYLASDECEDADNHFDSQVWHLGNGVNYSVAEVAEMFGGETIGAGGLGNFNRPRGEVEETKNEYAALTKPTVSLPEYVSWIKNRKLFDDLIHGGSPDGEEVPASG